MLEDKYKVGNITKFTKNDNKYSVLVYSCKACCKEISLNSAQVENHSGYCIKCSSTMRRKITKLKTRICRECNFELDIGCFTSKNYKYSKLTCHKCFNLKKYGITYRDYLRILEKQNHVCAICKNSEIVKHSNRNNVLSLAVDHNHVDGKVRGLLCVSCNRALGLFKDDILSLQNAVEYLRNI